MKQWHFFDKVYRRWVCVFRGNLDEFREEMKMAGYKHYEELQDSNGMLICLNTTNNDKGNDAYIIWLKDKSDDTLVHEATHLVMAIFDDLAIPISWDNTEAFAHYTEHWYREIKHTLRKHPNGRAPEDARKEKYA